MTSVPPSVEDAMADEPLEVENWVRQQVLGSGGFGIVTLWQNKLDGKMIAVKKCRWGTDSLLTPKHKERWTNEVEIMQRLSHRGVVRALPVPPELERELRGELPLLCMEFCSKGDLRQVLNRSENCCGLREPEIRLLIRDVTNAVEYLHANKITHRDLKPENIVMQDGDNSKVMYKLIDLGYAKELDQSSMCASFVGTLQYLAPELFLSKKYSCTVDYWSLGLVAHEIITGVRPFLPSMPPVAWMTHVQRKAQDDICAYQNEDGSISFSKQLFPQNHISTSLQYNMEKWLRLLLDWDPKRRGRVTADSEALLVFSVLHEILEKKVVPVFCVPCSQVLSYEVDNSTELSTLQQWVARDTGLAVSEQELLLPRGVSPDPKLPASQCCPPPDAPAEWTVFVLNKKQLILPTEVKPMLPPLVGEMIKDGRSPVAYVFQKRAWAHAVYFLQQEAVLYCSFLRAHRAKMLQVLSASCELGKLVQHLGKERQRATAQHEIFVASLAIDTSKADEVPKSQIKDLSVLWRHEGDQLAQRLRQLEETCTRFEAKAEEVGALALQLQRSPFARIRITSNLDNLAEAGQQVYETLRKRSKEERQKPQGHGDMARVVYNCLKHRDKLLHDEPFTAHLKQLVACKEATDNVLRPLQDTLKQLVSLRADIRQGQLDRQAEIWTLLSSEISRQSISDAPAVPVRESSMQQSRGAIPKQQPTSPSRGTKTSASASPQASSRALDPYPRPAAGSGAGGMQSLPPRAVAPPQGNVLHSLPTMDTGDIIHSNQELRYMTQDLFNKSFQVYREYVDTVNAMHKEDEDKNT